jgi:hypothetical protein
MKVFLVLFLPTSSRIFAALRLDEKEPKNQENLKLPCPTAGAARKIFGPTHGCSNGDYIGGEVNCLPACGEVNCFLFGLLWSKMIREAGNAREK